MSGCPAVCLLTVNGRRTCFIRYFRSKQKYLPRAAAVPGQLSACLLSHHPLTWVSSHALCLRFLWILHIVIRPIHTSVLVLYIFLTIPALVTVFACVPVFLFNGA